MSFSISPCSLIELFINSLKYKQLIVKRTFDIFFSTLGLIVFIIPLTFAFICASLDTGMNGFYKQERIGRYGKKFNIFKIRTMKNIKGVETTITTLNDERITKLLSSLVLDGDVDVSESFLNMLLGAESTKSPA